jgi:hypothetical protein
MCVKNFDEITTKDGGHYQNHINSIFDVSITIDDCCKTDHGTEI